MTILEKIKHINEYEWFDPYFISNEVSNWPLIPLNFNGQPILDPEMEPLDLENWKVTEFGDKHIIIQCGGDWQSPHEVRIELNSNDELECTSCNPCDFNGPDIDMDALLD